MPSTDTADEPEALVHRWFEDLFNRGELSVADEILSEHVEYHGPPSLSPQDVTGPADIKEYVDVYKTAFPDMVYSVEEVHTTEGETRVRWTATGTHESDLFGMDPTGEMMTVEGISVFRTDEDGIRDIRAQWDTLKMVQELGVVPSVGLAAETPTTD